MISPAIIKALLNRNRLLTLMLSILAIVLGLTDNLTGSLFEYNRTDISLGQYWRLISCNLVHYGTAHVTMNVAAFLLVGWALLGDIPLKNYFFLLLITGLAVSLGTYAWNPELEFYRGLSGMIHGLIVAGLFLNRHHRPRLTWVFIALVFAKIIHEHQPDFEENQLQALLPVKVAVDAHLYGALAGLAYCALSWVGQRLSHKDSARH